MDVAHVFRYEKYATMSFFEAIRKHKCRIRCVNVPRKSFVIGNDEHFYMGEHKYYTQWCKGRTYMLGGESYYSDYPVRKENTND